MTRTRHRAMVLLAALAGCGAPATDVAISTHVGPRYSRNDVEQSRAQALLVGRTLLSELMPRRAAVVDPNEVQQQPVHPPTDAHELAQLTEAVRTAPMDELSGPARRLASAPPAVWPQVRAALLADRTAPKGDYRGLLDAIGGDLPNRYGHFARAWKKAHGFAVKISDDWFEDLLMLPPGRISRGLRKVYRDCVLQTALLRAASSIGRADPTLTDEVVATLLDTAYIHKGTFRDEVGRAIVGIGDEAIAHLLIESISPSTSSRDRDTIPVRRAAYATLQLDRMDRLHPARATAAVSEQPRRLVVVLSAYGTVRPGEAASVLLDFADADEPPVRRAARAAFMAYVDGPPPAASHRKVRLLGGGTANKRSHLTYRQRAAVAIRQRIEQDVPPRLEPACEIHREDGTLDRTCEDQPLRLTHAYFAWLDERRTAGDAQALAAAMSEPDPHARVARLDRLLAGNPTLAVGPTLVAVYREAATSAREHGDVARAGQLLRKAARLAQVGDEDQGQALRVEALLAEAEVPTLTQQGRQMLLASAHELAPDDPRIDTAWAQARVREPTLTDPNTRWTPVAGLAFGLWGLGAMGSWWRRRRTRRSSEP